jgi:hypothetical protein
MRPAAVIKVMGLVLIAAFVGSWAAPAAAQEDCLAQCIEQYDQDKVACDNQLAARLAELDLEAQACLDNNPTDPIAAGLCLRNVNIKRYNARSDWRRCVSFANTAAYNCYRACQVSPSQP